MRYPVPQKPYDILQVLKNHFLQFMEIEQPRQ